MKKNRLLFLCNLESDQVIPVGTLVLPLIVVVPWDLPAVAHVHQRWEHRVVTVTADTSGLVGVYIELVAHLVSGTAVLQDADNFSLIDRFFNHI